MGLFSSLFGGDAPDTSGVNDAARAQAALSKEELAWAKQIYGDTAPDRAAATSRANAVSDAQLEQMKQQTTIAQDYSDYNKGTFRPLEQGIASEAANYDTPERQQAESDKAIADVGSQADAQADAQTRNMARMGVTPNSGRMQAMQGELGISEAAAKAGAAAKARTQVETAGFARQMDAASLGRGLASSQSTAAGLALTAGNNSSINGQAGGNINAQGNQIMNQGFNGASNAMSSAGQLYGQQAQIQNQANQSSNSLFGSLGQVAGAYLIGSDKTIKESRKPVSPQSSLAALRKLPAVESWRYKKGSVGDDGGKKHVGSMAQDVQRTLGNATAPSGKKIDLISMNGHLTNAVKQLDKDVMALKNARRLH